INKGGGDESPARDSVYLVSYNYKAETLYDNTGAPITPSGGPERGRNQLFAQIMISYTMIYHSSNDRYFNGAYCPYGSMVSNGSGSADGEA
ncbi:MAG: hypothetical protein ACYC6C_14105, partial [Coriobacteriia bacterium]